MKVTITLPALDLRIPNNDVLPTLLQAVEILSTEERELAEDEGLPHQICSSIRMSWPAEGDYQLYLAREAMCRKIMIALDGHLTVSSLVEKQVLYANARHTESWHFRNRRQAILQRLRHLWLAKAIAVVKGECKPEPLVVELDL